MIQAYADRVVIKQNGCVVADHARAFARRNDLRSLALCAVSGTRAGALRNGAPFKDWVLPHAVDRIPRKLAGSDDGDRQIAKILAMVLDDGLAAVEAACSEAPSEHVFSGDVIINIISR